MDATFEIEVDPARDLVRTRLSGFFTPESIAAYVAARTHAFAKLRCPVTEHLALTDLRELKIQSQEVVAAFASLLADPANQARRLAFIVATTLTRTQVQRAIGDRDARCFLDPSEAKTWLLSGAKRARLSAAA